MKIFCNFPTVIISKPNFWLVICIAMNLIWTTLKAIFSIFRFVSFFAPSDSRFTNSCLSAKYCPNNTNHTSMERWCINLKWLKSPYDWFCGPGSHILILFKYSLNRLRCVDSLSERERERAAAQNEYWGSFSISEIFQYQYASKKSITLWCRCWATGTALENWMTWETEHVKHTLLTSSDLSQYAPTIHRSTKPSVQRSGSGRKRPVCVTTALCFEVNYIERKNVKYQ